MTQYLALTIGPIYKTIRQARHTKELWAASFLFSRLMEHLLFALDPDNSRTILPRTDIAQPDVPLFGAGIFPDRLFMEAQGMTRQSVDTAINTAFKALAAETLPSQTDTATVEAALDFWRRYLRIEYVLLPLDALEGGALVTRTTPYLDTQELADTWIHEAAGPDFLTELLTGIYKLPLSEPLKKSKGVYAGFMSGFFPSTDEIASLELWQQFPDAYGSIKKNTPEDEHDLVYRNLEQDERIRPALRDHHKYFCIVYADGDYIGKTIAQLNTENEYREFSRLLSGFAANSAQLINAFGGKPVYIGGDDLLFLAPVYSEKGSILELLTALDGAFGALNLQGNPTLSFGVCVVYYKYPLFESIEIAYRQLLAAKSYRKGTAGKNAVGISLIKHSGSEFEFILNKTFLAKLVAAQRALRGKTSETLLSSLVYKLRTLERLLVTALDHAGPAQAGARLEHLLGHYFNDSFTGGRDIDAQKQAVSELILTAWKHSPDGPGGASAAWANHLYGALRLLKFITDQPKTVPA